MTIRSVGSPGSASARRCSAWSITIAMLALAGVPGTVGFIGKFQLIHALVDGGYGWLAIVLVVGAMISLGYYLRVVAAVWMSPAEPPRSLSGGAAGALPRSPAAHRRPTSCPTPRSSPSPRVRGAAARRSCWRRDSRDRCSTSPPTRARRSPGLLAASRAAAALFCGDSGVAEISGGRGSLSSLRVLAGVAARR